MKVSKTLIWANVAIALVLIAVIVIYCYKRKNDEETLPGGDSEGRGESAATIKYGDTGESVKSLQAYLNGKLIFFYFEKGSRPIYNGSELTQLDVDGIFGKRTLCATKWWFGRESVTLNDLK